MMKLYWSPRSRSFTALWLMEETGQPYERVLTDITTGAQKTPEYLAINPMGKVPALQGRRRDARRSRRDLRLRRRALSRGQAGAAARRSAAREISLLAVLLAGLHRAGDHADLHQDRDESGRPPAGATRSAGVRRAGQGAAERPVDPRRQFLRRRRHDRLGPELSRCGCSRWCRRGRRSTPTSTRCVERPAFQRAEKIAAG